MVWSVLEMLYLHSGTTDGELITVVVWEFEINDVLKYTLCLINIESGTFASQHTHIVKWYRSCVCGYYRETMTIVLFWTHDNRTVKTLLYREPNVIYHQYCKIYYVRYANLLLKWKFSCSLFTTLIFQLTSFDNIDHHNSPFIVYMFVIMYLSNNTTIIILSLAQ